MEKSTDKANVVGGPFDGRVIDAEYPMFHAFWKRDREVPVYMYDSEPEYEELALARYKLEYFQFDDDTIAFVYVMVEVK